MSDLDLELRASYAFPRLGRNEVFHRSRPQRYRRGPVRQSRTRACVAQVLGPAVFPRRFSCTPSLLARPRKRGVILSGGAAALAATQRRISVTIPHPCNSQSAPAHHRTRVILRSEQTDFRASLDHSRGNRATWRTTKNLGAGTADTSTRDPQGRINFPLSSPRERQSPDWRFAR
jgi:hypothetical protein